MTTVYRYGVLAIYGLITFLFYSAVFSTPTFSAFWDWWSKLLTQSINQPFLILFIGGLSVNKLAANFAIYHHQRPWQVQPYYPSIMNAVSVTLIIWFLSSGIPALPYINTWELTAEFYPLILGLIFLPIIHTALFYKTKQNNLTTINAQSQLNTQTQYICDQITNHLENEQSKCVRIAICGPFGVGKSTAIEHALEKLKANKNSNIIYCNIDFWGVKTDSIIVHTINEILITLSTKMDMCAFRSLPSHYMAALNSGNTTSKILAAFINKPISPEQLLNNLSNVLVTLNIRLIVSIQDLDRNSDAELSLEALAGFLDRLSSLKNINYIFAAENKPAFAETILRICPIRLDFIQPDFTNEVTNLVAELIDLETKDYYNKVLQANYEEEKNCSEFIAQLIPSFRNFTTFKTQVESNWKNLKFEVLIYDLMLIIALKHNQPHIYEAISALLQNEAHKEQELSNFIQSNFQHPDERTLKLIKDCLGHFGFINNFSLSQNIETISSEYIPRHPFSVNKNPHIVRALITGQLGNHKQKEIFDTLLASTKGSNISLSTLCNSVKKAQPESHFWLKSIQNYGWYIFYTEIKSTETAKKILIDFICIPDPDLSYSMLKCFKIGNYIDVNESKWLEYLSSNTIKDDLYLIRDNFKSNTLSGLLELYSAFTSFSRTGLEMPLEYKRLMNELINRFISSEDSMSQAITLSFFNKENNNARQTILDIEVDTLRNAIKLIESTNHHEVATKFANLAGRKYLDDIRAFEDVKKGAIEFIKDYLRMNNITESI